MKLGLREAHQRFSKAIKAVLAGKVIVLTDRGRPIAVIKPIEGAAGPEAGLKRMAEEGLVTLPTRKGPLSRFEPVPTSGKPISHTIIDDRV
jgi:prevent-host-death family protein